MKHAIIIVLLISISQAYSCSNDFAQFNIDCDTLTNGLIDHNKEQLDLEFTKLTDDLEPNISSDDPNGHLENFNLLVSRLNSECSTITAKSLCYACIKTGIPQSEIIIEFDSQGVKLSKVIDIYTSNEDVLSFAGIHN